jgi:serine O-acetyltransferase
MYQGAVLGGTSLKKEKRHPTVGNGVVIGARAVALGAITIGDGARIGAGSVVIKSVPSGATVVGIPGRIVEEDRKTMVELERGQLPDPVAGAIRLVLREQDKLKERLRRLETPGEVIVPPGGSENKRREIVREFSGGGGI